MAVMPGVLMGTGAACSAIGPNGQAGATGLTVAIPVVTDRDGSGVESVLKGMRNTVG